MIILRIKYLFVDVNKFDNFCIHFNVIKYNFCIHLSDQVQLLYPVCDQVSFQSPLQEQ